MLLDLSDIPADLTLRRQLLRLFAALRRTGIRVSIPEQVDAIIIARESQTDDREVLRTRLRSVLLKTPDKDPLRRFNRAFDDAFEAEQKTVDVPPPWVVPVSEIPKPQKDPDTEGENTGTKVTSAQKSRWLPIGLIILALGVIFAIYFMRGPVGTDDPIGIIEPNTDPDEQTSNGKDFQDGPKKSNPTDSRNETEDLFRIALMLHLTADRNGRINLNAIAESFSGEPLAAIDPALFAHRLSRLSGVDPELVFILDGPAMARLADDIQYLTTGFAISDEDLLTQLREFDDSKLSVISQQANSPRVASASSNVLEFKNFSSNLYHAMNDETREGSGFPQQEQAINDALTTVQATRDGLYLGPESTTPKGISTRFWLNAAFVSPLVFFLIWRVLSFRQRLKAWFHARPPDQRVKPHYLKALDAALDDAIGSDQRIRAARDLARPQLRPSARLDPQASAMATVDNAGRFVPVLATVRNSPHYLALITRQGRNDHQAKRYEELIQSFGLLRTALDVWFIDQDGDSVFRSYSDRRISLKDLYSRLPDHRLLVLGDGQVFLSPTTGDPQTFADTLRKWQFSALLTPKDPETWNRSEAMLSTLFHEGVVNATPDGLAKLAKAARSDAASEQRPNRGPKGARVWHLDPRILLRQSQPGPELLARLQNDLFDELPGPGLRWLRAAAVYPEINWELTLYLGQELKDQHGNSLVTADRFGKLASLPWFREGYMPEWARIWLTGQMSSDDRTEVVSILCGCLANASATPDRPDRAPAFVTVGESPPDDAETARLFNRDVIWLELLASNPPRGTAMEGTPSLAEKFRATRTRFVLQEFIVSGVCIFYSGMCWLLLPRGGSAVLAGDYLPATVVLLAGLLFLPLILSRSQITTKWEATP